MTGWTLLLNIIQNVAVIGILAYLLTRLSAVRRTLCDSQYGLRDKLLLMFVFGLFSALGNWLGIPVIGSMANNRIVAPIAGGLVGGPLVGIGAGVIGAVPRYLMGGYTMWASVSANVIAGCISGLVYYYMGTHRINVKVALGTGLVCEIILKLMVLGMSKPFEKAWELEKIIGIPTIIANSLAVALFVYIIKDVFREQEKVQQRSAQQLVSMLYKSSDLFQSGLNERTAREIVLTIYNETGATAVAVTDTEKVLAFVGEGAEHHRVGAPILTAATQRAIRDKQMLVLYGREEIGCPHADCPLNSVVEAILLVSGKPVGTLKLYRGIKEVITPYEVELIQGIAVFMSLQLAQQQLEQQKIMLGRVEFNMLKAQVNPHFLFNTLGTIRALIRMNPAMARVLVKDLADFLRTSLDRHEEVVTLSKEMEIVARYYRIEKARFGERISMKVDIPRELLEHPIPVFTLQPLIENTVRHGLADTETGGLITITARQDEDVTITITDNGCGISPEILEKIQSGQQPDFGKKSGIGLYNVDGRIKIIYGERYGLKIDSRPGEGTRIDICLPREG